VANVSQGLAVTWGGVTLGEVVSVSVDGITAETVDVTPRSQAARYKKYSRADGDYGSVSLTVRGAAGMAATNVGLTATLSISGPGVSWSFGGAMFETLGWSAGVGELQTYSVTFKIGA
jgi:hypothetical protein